MNEKSGLVNPPTTRSERRLSATRYLKLNRLPTLQEVLDRRTRPPLDLFCFYIFLQRENAEDALDFWLDVQQHENMCKAYLKDLRRSGRTIQEDWPAFAAYARTNGSHFAPLLELPEGDEGLAFGSPQTLHSEKHPLSAGHSSALGQDDGRLKATARRSSEIMTPSPRLDTSRFAAADIDSPLPSPGMRQRSDTESHPIRPLSPNPASPAGGEFGSQMGSGRSRENTSGRETTRSRMSIRGNWGEKKPKAPTVIARDRAIEKSALIEGAERIYLRYLLPGAEREIYLPPSLRIHNFPVSSASEASPLIPDLFHAQKVYIFKALEQDAFPRFLRAKAFGNLTPLSSFIRLIAGLVILWAGFVLGFSLIFLDWQPKSHRLYVIIPFLFATNLLMAAYYSLSPLLVLFRQTETTPFRLIRIKEKYVEKLLILRALYVEAVCLVITAMLTLIFVLVPGKRL